MGASSVACVRAWLSATRRLRAISAFPLLAVVPLTGTAGVGALYPELEPGVERTRQGFVQNALIDQIRSVDKRRVRRAYGRIARDEIRALDQGLLLFLGSTPLDVEFTVDFARPVPRPPRRKG